VEGFWYEAVHPVVDRLEQDLVVHRRHQDHRGLRPLAADLLHEFQSGKSWHDLVGEHQVGVVFPVKP